MMQSLGAKTILYPTPVLIVGTYDDEGRPNLMTCSWGGICNSKPPSIAVSLRAATYSHGCILKRGAFTVGIPSASQVKAADYIGLVSGRDHDKSAEMGLTVVRSTLVDAPYVAEFPLVVECRLAHRHELGLHTQFVGEVIDVKADASVLDARGHIDVERLQPLCFGPEDGAYYRMGEKVGQAFQIGRT